MHGKNFYWVPCRELNSDLLTGSRRTTNRATPHLIWATPHPSELRRTLLSYAAPFWAALHPTELRWTLLNYTPRPTELSRILSNVTSHSYWATPHPHGATQNPLEWCEIEIKYVQCTHSQFKITCNTLMLKNTMLQYFKDMSKPKISLSVPIGVYLASGNI
jgi:hypothetical protein